MGKEAIIHGHLIVYEKLWRACAIVAVHGLSTTHTKQQRSKTENIIVNTILLSVLQDMLNTIETVTY